MMRIVTCLTLVRHNNRPYDSCSIRDIDEGGIQTCAAGYFGLTRSSPSTRRYGQHANMIRCSPNALCRLVK